MRVFPTSGNLSPPTIRGVPQKRSEVHQASKCDAAHFTVCKWKAPCEIHLGSMVLQVGDTQRIDEVCGVEIRENTSGLR